MKRKVTILRNIGSDFEPKGFAAGAFKGLREGQVIDLGEKETDQLLSASLCEVVEHAVDVPPAAHKKETK